MKEKLLTIIVPVYNVEKFIYSCITSLLQQNLDEDNYEIILINDDTPDRSIEVIADLIQAHPHIQVLQQRNQGPSAARNLGVRKATGKYILYVDSDDMLIKNSLKTILDIAVREEADLVMADYIYCNVEEEEMPAQTGTDIQPATSIKTGRHLFMEDLNPEESFIWRTLYRRDFLKETGLTFIEGIMFEDIPYLQECYLKAGKCVRMSYPFYIYRRRHGTLSSAINEKSILDMNKSMEKIWELSLDKDITQEEKEKLRDNLFVYFSKNLWYISHIKKLLPQRKVFVSDLLERIPGLSFHNGLKQRIISCLFRMMPSTYIKLRSVL